MATELSEASIVRRMFGTTSDNDDEEAFEDEEEEKYPSSRYNNNNHNNHNTNHTNNNDLIETDGHEFKGLKNQGATCYLNALLQSLYFTPELREGIYQLTPEDLGVKHIEEADKLDADISKYKLRDEDITMLTSLGYTTTRAKRALVKAENNYEKAKTLLETNCVPSVKRILLKLREFFSLLSISSGEHNISTKELTDAFGWISREVGVQHDAHELNRILIDAIERSLRGSKNESLINNIYLGQMVSRTLCLQCEYCSERKENFLDAIVQVQNHSNLSESLSSQCKSEYLVGENKYFCEKCNAKCDAKRSVAYTKLPNVLTLALNRFIFNLYTMNREKCTSSFEFPLIFDFEPFLDSKLSLKQTHRTKEDEESLAKANDEYEREKKRKQDIAERKKKDEVENKISSMSKAPLAIEAPPGTMSTQITTGTHTDVAPLPQSVTQNMNMNMNMNTTQWRQQIPRSRSQEDEDVKRAIAESLGEVYVPPQAQAQPRAQPQALSKTTRHYTHNHAHAHNINMSINEEAFEAQKELDYEVAVDILLNGSCCFGVYDVNIKQWRTAVFIQKWDNKKRLMLRFTQDNNSLNPSGSSSKFITIKEFPVDYIIDDWTRFDVKERDLRDMSNVEKEKIDEWVTRKKQRETQKEIETKKKKEKKQRETRAQKEIETKEKEEKEEREKEEKERIETRKEQIETIKEPIETTKEQIETTQETEETEDVDNDNDNKEEKLQDWTKRTDFNGVPLVGYLCDDGEVIQGDCLRQSPGKIFVHFNTDAGHFGKKYAWITVPNDRLCPPPKTRPKQKNMPFMREMRAFRSDMYPSTSSGAGGVGTGATTDYGSRDESSIIGASPWNRNKHNNRYPQWKLHESDINLNSNHLYALTGVVIHRGTPHAGHYHAYLKDFMCEGKYQKKAEKNEETKSETAAFVSAVCDNALWYDFNDKSVHRIPCTQLAKQYGGGASYDECAYMLVYRKINKESLREVMESVDVRLPKDLMQYTAQINEKYELEKRQKQAKQNEIKIQIVDPKCFMINTNGELSMNPFIESLLKKIIRLSNEKDALDCVIENKENRSADIDCDELYLNKTWPSNMSSKELNNIVSEHYKQNSIFITCDGRDPIDKLMSDLTSRFASINDIKLHFLSIPSVFSADDITCESISALIDCNIVCNVDDRFYPILDDDNDDDGYPYQSKPVLIRDLPLKYCPTCFVWNGVDINGVSFSLPSSPSVSIRIRYHDKSSGFIQDVINVSGRASLSDIFAFITDKYSLDIKLPVFTLLSTSPRDWPDIIYFGDGVSSYSQSFYARASFARILHHRQNPMRRWRSQSNARECDNTLWGEAILCIENALNLPFPHHDTGASQEWQESTKFSTIIVEDYTQLKEFSSEKEEKEEKEYKASDSDSLGSSHSRSASLRILNWRIPRGTSLSKFFEIARNRCAIPDSVDLRAFRLYDGERFLITFPHKFQLREHRLMLERGRYPSYNEVFLMVSIAGDKYLPLIVDRSKSVKFVKQEILRLFKMDSGVKNYKKYVCCNVNNSQHCWRDAQTLNSSSIQPRHGDRIAIQIGVDLIHKSCVIMSDSRDIGALVGNEYTSVCSKSNNNPYIKQELGTLNIEGDATLDSLRQQMYRHMNSMNSTGDIASYKHLLLSWYDSLYHIPLSFPMLKDGKLQNQKNFNSIRSVICVEICDEEIDCVPKNARFLHIHLAQYVNSEVLFSPGDHHIRIIYNEMTSGACDRITYKHLAQFVCTKYDILVSNLLIAMFKINRGEWCIVDDRNDEMKQGLVATPFCITKTNRHGQIFAIFDLAKCEINSGETTNENKRKFLCENLKYFAIPPLSNKAKFYFKHFNQTNQTNSSNSINEFAKGINNTYKQYDRQLKITNID